MQLRCTFCQTMFAVSHEEELAALQTMTEEKLTYSHVYCPKCRRANRVEKVRLERSYPNWKADLKAMEKAVKPEETKPVEAKPEKTKAGSKK